MKLEAGRDYVGLSAIFNKCPRGCSGCATIRIRTVTYGKKYLIENFETNWTWGRVLITNDLGKNAWMDGKHFTLE